MEGSGLGKSWVEGMGVVGVWFLGFGVGGRVKLGGLVLCLIERWWSKRVPGEARGTGSCRDVGTLE